jgi:hypothetical protein
VSKGKAKLVKSFRIVRLDFEGFVIKSAHGQANREALTGWSMKVTMFPNCNMKLAAAFV